MSKEISVVILNWNGIKFLKEFIPILIKYTNPDISEIVVADNDSSDNSVEFLKTTYPNVRLVLLEKNYGFAEGYNKAINQLNSDYIVLLNSDVEVTENWLEPLYKLIKSDNKIAVCVPKIKDYHNKNSFEYAGAAGGFIDKYGFPFCRGRIFESIEKDTNQYNDYKSIFWASGACLVIKKKLYIEAGGLDKDFFAHMEEIDLCWRLKNMDYDIMYCPESTVFHVGGGTLNKENPFKTYLNFRNNLFLLYKNLPSNKLYSILFIRLLFDGIASIKFLFDFKFKMFLAIIKAHFHFYRDINIYRKKRNHNIKYLYTKYNHSEIYNISIVYNYFLRKKKDFSNLKL